MVVVMRESEPCDGPRTSGVVKWFNDEKGFGFITSENGDDFLVHASDVLMDGGKYIREGSSVEFDVCAGPKGLQAENVAIAAI